MKKHYFTIGFILIGQFAFAQNFEAAIAKAKGNCLEKRVSFFNDGLLDFLSVKTYDENGNLTKKSETFSQNLNGPYTTENLYEYDAKNNNTKVVSKQNGIQKSVITKEYNDAGKLTKETLSNGGNATIATASSADNVSGSIAEKVLSGNKSKEIKTLDKAGNLLKQENFSSDGKLSSSLTNEFDVQGNKSKMTRFEAATNISEEINLTFDAAGNLLNEKTLRNQEAFSETKYEYSQRKLSKKIHLNRYNQIDYHFTFEYDLAGKLVKESYFANNQFVNSTTFEYDTNDNKTKESYFNKAGNLTGYKAWEYSCK
jgi:hypothetical protein